MRNPVMSLDQAFEAVHDMKVVGDAARNQSAESRVALNALVEIGAFGGQAADAIGNLIQTQYTPLLMAIENAYWMQGVKAREMVESFMEAMGETDNNAAFDHDALINLESEIDLTYDDLIVLNEELQNLYLNVEDIVSLSMPHTTPAEREYVRAQNEVCAIRDILGEFSFSFSEIEDLMYELEYFIQKLDNNRGLDPTSDARRDIMNGGQFDFEAFTESMGELHNEFLDTEVAALETLIRSWEGQDIETILLSLSNPMTQAEQLAFMGLLASMSDEAFSIFGSVVDYVISPTQLTEIGLDWLIQLGIASVDRFHRQLYFAFGAYERALDSISILRGIGDAVKKAFPCVVAGVGTIMDIWNGGSIGAAVSYNAAALVVTLSTTSAGIGIAAFFLGANPVGWAFVGTIAIGTFVVVAGGILFALAYEHTPIGYAVDFVGDVIDAVIDSTVAGFNNAVNFASDLWHADNLGEVWEATVDHFNAGVDNIVNFGTDLWDAGANLVNNTVDWISDVGQAISDSSLNPFNWNWGD